MKIDDLKKTEEHIRPFVEDLTEAEQAILFKHLRALGHRDSYCDDKIRKGTAKDRTSAPTIQSSPDAGQPMYPWFIFGDDVTPRSQPSPMPNYRTCMQDGGGIVHHYPNK